MLYLDLDHQVTKVPPICISQYNPYTTTVLVTNPHPSILSVPQIRACGYPSLSTFFESTVAYMYRVVGKEMVGVCAAVAVPLDLKKNSPRRSCVRFCS